ncbi:hypothetical protein COCSUDRAFT_33646 [Coccomyxa subellipsoidea C-169]|uniref:Uncharacterized protein n=1 Tax=Coccomyxa subellipsoidea (strain C-169) TaxID=574566 RepID=I0YSI4_COCSC|nr:hypothetical protein COCSUDRAFT_33646 [Coccomyxa subellipsoidea C-169]EIE21353.1 hypothetical protein COCSUDRAFT_33646 [Coccomyxa subellipsoidea C-169]|eukprot:XP_005645897.1 hypothetical protein COCSUDRAFT_33646 [Coccomyxa subellipsoidea C-169]
MHLSYWQHDISERLMTDIGVSSSLPYFVRQISAWAADKKPCMTAGIARRPRDPSTKQESTLRLPGFLQDSFSICSCHFPWDMKAVAAQLN